MARSPCASSPRQQTRQAIYSSTSHSKHLAVALFLSTILICCNEVSSLRTGSDLSQYFWTSVSERGKFIVSTIFLPVSSICRRVVGSQEGRYESCIRADAEAGLTQTTLGVETMAFVYVTAQPSMHAHCNHFLGSFLDAICCSVHCHHTCLHSCVDPPFEHVGNLNIKHLLERSGI